MKRYFHKLSDKKIDTLNNTNSHEQPLTLKINTV